jgi:hypothetical protein
MMHAIDGGDGTRCKLGEYLQISLRDSCFDAFSSREPVPTSLESALATPRFDRGALIGDKPAMAKKPGTNPKGEFAFFDVVYEDGSQRSNRRVPAELLGGLEGDEPARGYIIEQDREIAEKGGRPPLKIKDISRVGAKKKKSVQA